METNIAQDKQKIKENENANEALNITNKKQQEEISQIMEKSVKIWQAEKITVIHNIDQETLTNLTYKTAFDEDWKYDILKMILCNLLKNTFFLDIKAIEQNDDELKAESCRKKIMELFKKECFKSAKFKNMLLETENFKVDVDDSYNVYPRDSEFCYTSFLEKLEQPSRTKYIQEYNKWKNQEDEKKHGGKKQEIKDGRKEEKINYQYMDISKAFKYFHYVKERIFHLHEKEIKKQNKEFINVWIPLLCTVQEILNLSLANEKVKSKENDVIAKVKI